MGSAPEVQGHWATGRAALGLWAGSRMTWADSRKKSRARFQPEGAVFSWGDTGGDGTQPPKVEGGLGSCDSHSDSGRGNGVSKDIAGIARGGRCPLSARACSRLFIYPVESLSFFQVSITLKTLCTLPPPRNIGKTL